MHRREILYLGLKLTLLVTKLGTTPDVFKVARLAGIEQLMTSTKSRLMITFIRVDCSARSRSIIVGILISLVDT